MRSLVSALLTPSNLVYLLATAGLLMIAWRKVRRWSLPLLAASSAMNLVLSSGWIAGALISPLEYSHPTLKEISPSVRYIVALTGWAADDNEMPPSGRLNASSAYRTMLAVELANRCRECQVIVSGEPFTASLMREVMIGLGLDPHRVAVEGSSKTTAESAEHLRPLVGESSFILVTSAGHMPRALQAMKERSLRAIPAPTDHKLPHNWREAHLTPSPFALDVTNLAVHEYVGRIWYGIRPGS